MIEVDISKSTILSSQSRVRHKETGATGEVKFVGDDGVNVLFDGYAASDFLNFDELEVIG